MKLFVRIILIGGLTYFLSFYFPWWIVTVVAFAVGALIPGGGLNVFISGFLGAGIVWLGYAWKLDEANNSSFSSTIVQLFPIPQDPIFLVVVSGLAGALCGGLGALTGSLLRKPKKSTRAGYYQ
jgi:hypothetical protein